MMRTSECLSQPFPLVIGAPSDASAVLAADADADECFGDLAETADAGGLHQDTERRTPQANVRLRVTVHE